MKLSHDTANELQELLPPIPMTCLPKPVSVLASLEKSLPEEQRQKLSMSPLKRRSIASSASARSAEDLPWVLSGVISSFSGSSLEALSHWESDGLEKLPNTLNILMSFFRRNIAPERADPA